MSQTRAPYRERRLVRPIGREPALLSGDPARGVTDERFRLIATRTNQFGRTTRNVAWAFAQGWPSAVSSASAKQSVGPMRFSFGATSIH
jgi:hypothetical protein